MGQRRFAPTVTMDITPTLARPMGSMAQIILLAACLSVPGRGSMVSAATASLIADSVGIAGSAVIVGSVVIVGSMATGDSGVIVDSMAVANSTAVTDFTAAVVEDSMAAVAVHMVAVASMEVAEVTAAAVGNRG